MAIYETSSNTGPLRQGEILSDVVEVRLAPECVRCNLELSIHEILHPFALVLAQDCDLDWDFRYRFTTDPAERAKLANKLIPNVLLCQAESVADFRGTPGINSDLWRRIAKNSDERYHVLPDVPTELDQAGDGIPSLAMDFKRLFSVPTDELYLRLGTQAKRRAFLLPPFLQSLSSRFSYLLFSPSAMPNCVSISLRSSRDIVPSL